MLIRMYSIGHLSIRSTFSLMPKEMHLSDNYWLIEL